MEITVPARRGTGSGTPIARRVSDQRPSPRTSGKSLVLPHRDKARLRWVIGRERERALIDGLLAGVQAGSAQVVTVLGDAGIGKSELCDYAAGQAAGMSVIRTVGVEFETDLPFVGLLEVLLPLRHRVGELPESQRLAARALIEFEGKPGDDPFVLGAATLSLLTLEAEQSPVLVVVDDVHWLDELSRRALGFALRRLQADAVAAVITSRPVQPEPMPGPWPRMVLTGLDRAAAHHMLAANCPSGVHEQVAERVWSLTGGNPLAIIEAASMLTADQLSGDSPLPDPLPLGERGRFSFGHRLGRLSPDTQRALAVVAVGGSATTVVLSAALSRVDLSLEDLQPAESQGFLQHHDGIIRFAHPLVRAAVVAALDAPARRSTHRTLSEAFEGIDMERQAWHLAEGSEEPSEAVASALERAAGNARERGGTAAAATALAASARLSPPGPARTQRLTRAGRALLAAGRRHEAARIVDELLLVGDSMSRSNAWLLEASLAVWSESAPAAPPRLWAAYGELSEALPEAAALVGLALAVVLGSLGRLHEMADISRQVLSLPVTDDRIQLSSRCTHALAAIFLGDRRPLTDLERRGGVDEVITRLGADSGAISSLVQALIFGEGYDAAERLIGAQVRTARSRSAVSLLPFPIYARSDIGWRKGLLQQGRVDGDEALMLGQLTGADSLQGMAHATRARIAALEGDPEVCHQHAEEAMRLGARLRQLPPQLYVNHALGLLELGRGNPTGAVAHLEKNIVLEAVLGVGCPSTVPWKGDYIEALALSGQLERATETAADLERQGRASGSVWAVAASQRGRLLLEDRDWPELGQEAIHGLAAHPIEQARAYLVLGERLRRARRISDARGHLATAAAMFDRSGARPWLERANRELRATGGNNVSGRRSDLQPLTDQEVQVARLAANGATNREISAALFVSHKTVEYHLRKTFVKVGATNRTQLARLLETQGLLEITK